MKVWRFYIHEKEETTCKDKYALYAVTNHKDLAKRFSEERNMERFSVKYSKMERDEYSTFANENRNCVLKEEKLITKAINPNGTIGVKKIPVLVTFYEYQSSSGDEQAIDIFNENWWIKAGDFKMFSKPIRSALAYLYYNQFQKIVSFYDAGEDEDYSAPDTYVDEVLTFIKLFKDTF